MLSSSRAFLDVYKRQMMYRIPIERDYIVREMTDLSRGENWQASHGNEQYRQMTLFDIGMKT